MIRLHPLQLTFEAQDALVLPAQPGALWRSAIGARLRADACITGASQCRGCRVAERCAYAQLFEPPRRRAGLAPRFRDPPRPWVLAPGPGGRRVAAGEHLELGLTLMVDGLAYWPSLYRALQRLRLGPAPLRLVRVISRPPHGEPAPAPTKPLPGYRPEPPAPPPGDSVQVILESPLRLQHNGQPLTAEALAPEPLLAALLRRITSLDETAPEADHGALTRHAQSAIALREPVLHWHDADRSSSRQGRCVPLGGLLGHFRLEGALAPIWPWLWTGQWVHAGKSAVMGLGRFRLGSEG
ncbi:MULTISPECIES: CRISPR system precrRNA processing endoribonuclease RAMP protein Cas6 [unclassified Halorhodospira]|uniref:CRISPR system precrRNA processing endoribonuclease RAMP protein Cas6 n=1 Tax=unclassified Halorhodospira TaxID=2626748 RepID=UPI001EE913CC|nr:CRISPR system precrRNA processing endoribonuclease RAMP protein Cas6 [Halorhodospira sp. M39old]MCG5547072.1 CRISPR system precrRNA processing endoribonuclease RAMP protein Cas6 [Halorhodospira sp. M38]